MPHLRRWNVIATVVVGFAPAACTPRVGDLKDETAFRDISHTAFDPMPDVGGWPGLALFDFDNDGDIDILVTAASGLPNQLYQNDGAARFIDVAESSGLAFANDHAVTTGVGDFDNDGWLDLLIGRQAPPSGDAGTSVRFLKNTGGDGASVRFEDRTDETGLSGVDFASSLGVGDFDNDGLLDLYVGRYDFRGLSFSLGSYHEDTPNQLFRSTAIVDGIPVFADVTESGNAAGIPVSGVAPASENIINHVPTWSVYVSDVNGDGLQDIFVVHEVPGGVDLLINNGDFTFTPTQTEAMKQRGGWMGVTGGDVDRDGDVDYFVTNVGADAIGPEASSHLLTGSWRPPEGSPFHILLINDGTGALTDMTGMMTVLPGLLRPVNAAGGQGLSAYEFGFGCALFDANLDGWLDLTWTGDLNLSPNLPDGPLRRDFHGVARYLEANGAGRFSDRTAERGLFNMNDHAPLGFGYSRSGRALGTVDLNGDGFPDLVRTDRADDDAFRCLLNPGIEGAHWLVVRARGAAGNRFGLGAMVVITIGRDAVRGEIVTTTSAFTSVHPQVHFGLGTHESVDVLTVHWPSGAETTMTNVAADTIITVEEAE